jgi:hypothetical protein
MKRHHVVTALTFSRDAHVAHDATDSPAGHKHADAFCPDFVQLGEEFFIFDDVAKL